MRHNADVLCTKRGTKLQSGAGLDFAWFVDGVGVDDSSRSRRFLPYDRLELADSNTLKLFDPGHKVIVFSKGGEADLDELRARSNADAPLMKMVVSSDQAQLRDAPYDGSQILGQLNDEDAVDVVALHSPFNLKSSERDILSWCKVELPGGKTGWVSLKFLKELDKPQAKAGTAAPAKKAPEPSADRSVDDIARDIVNLAVQLAPGTPSGAVEEKLGKPGGGGGGLGTSYDYKGVGVKVGMNGSQLSEMYCLIPESLYPDADAMFSAIERATREILPDAELSKVTKGLFRVFSLRNAQGKTWVLDVDARREKGVSVGLYYTR
jgi:hypothetical protein